MIDDPDWAGRYSDEAVPESTQRTVRALGRVLAAKDLYLGQHGAAVARRTLELCDALGYFEQERPWLAIAGRLHDIGTIAITDLVILKPDSLTEREREIIRCHPVAGYHILGELAVPGSVCETVLYHHERLDGSGYPQGLIGDEIPLAARVLAVADVFEAMTAERPWRKALPIQQVFSELRHMAGSMLDATVVEALLARADSKPEEK